MNFVCLMSSFNVIFLSVSLVSINPHSFLSFFGGLETNMLLLNPKCTHTKQVI